MYTLSLSKNIKRSNYGEFLKVKNVLFMYTMYYRQQRTSTLRIWKVSYTAICMRKCTLWTDNTCVFTRFHSVKNANTQLIWSSVLPHFTRSSQLNTFYHTLTEALSSIHSTTLYQKLSAQYILPHFTRSSQLNTFYHTLSEALSSIYPTTLYQKLSAQYILPHFTRSSQLNTFYHTLPEALSSIHPTTLYQKLLAQYILPHFTEALSSIHSTTLYQKLSAQYILPHFTRSSQLNTSYHTLPEALSSIHSTTLYQKLLAQYILPHFTRSSQLNTSYHTLPEALSSIHSKQKNHIKWKILCAFLIYDISAFGPLNYLEPFRNIITNKLYGPSIPLRRSSSKNCINIGWYIKKLKMWNFYQLGPFVKTDLCLTCPLRIAYVIYF